MSNRYLKINMSKAKLLNITCCTKSTSYTFFSFHFEAILFFLGLGHKPWESSSLSHINHKHHIQFNTNYSMFKTHPDWTNSYLSNHYHLPLSLSLSFATILSPFDSLWDYYNSFLNVSDFTSPPLSNLYNNQNDPFKT